SLLADHLDRQAAAAALAAADRLPSVLRGRRVVPRRGGRAGGVRLAHRAVVAGALHAGRRRRVRGAELRGERGGECELPRLRLLPRDLHGEAAAGRTLARVLRRRRRIAGGRRRADRVLLVHDAAHPRAPHPDGGGVVARRAAAAAAAADEPAERLVGLRERDGALSGLGLLARDLDRRAAAPALRAGGLVGLLRRRGGVAGGRRRADRVRLRDGAAVAGAEHPDGRRVVRGAVLVRERAGERALLGRGVLPRDLDAG